MASQGPNSAGTGSNVLVGSGVGQSAWVNPANITSSDNVYSVYTVGDNFGDPNASNRLQATNFGFTIPSGSTINGVLVSVERKASSLTAVTDLEARLIVGGAVDITENKSTGLNWPTNETYQDYGGAADLWSIALTVSNVNASDFGFSLRTNGTTIGQTASVDHIRITVYYTEAATGRQLSSTRNASTGRSLASGRTAVSSRQSI